MNLVLGTRSILHHKELFEQLDADCRHASDENVTENNQQEHVHSGGGTFSLAFCIL